MTKPHFYTYRHIRLDTGDVFYVGKGTFDGSYKRAYSKRRRSTFWRAIVAKTLYEVQVVACYLNELDALNAEESLIQQYGRRDIGTGTLCNLADGGEGTSGIIRSQEHRIKLSLANSGKTHSEETRSKIRAAQLGNPKPPRSLEHRARLSAAAKRRYAKQSS